MGVENGSTSEQPLSHKMISASNSESEMRDSPKEVTEEMKSALNSLENLLVSEQTSIERSKHTNHEQRVKKIRSHRSKHTDWEQMMKKWTRRLWSKSEIDEREERTNLKPFSTWSLHERERERSWLQRKRELHELDNLRICLVVEKVFYMGTKKNKYSFFSRKTCKEIGGFYFR